MPREQGQKAGGADNCRETGLQDYYNSSQSSSYTLAVQELSVIVLAPPLAGPMWLHVFICFDSCRIPTFSPPWQINTLFICIHSLTTMLVGKLSHSALYWKLSNAHNITPGKTILS